MLSRDSAGIQQGNELTHNSPGNACTVHSHLTSVSHCRLIPDPKRKGTAGAYELNSTSGLKKRKEKKGAGACELISTSEEEKKQIGNDSSNL